MYLFGSHLKQEIAATGALVPTHVQRQPKLAGLVVCHTSSPEDISSSNCKSLPVE